MSIFLLILSTILLIVPIVIVNLVAGSPDSHALYANWFYAVSFFTGLIPRLILQVALIYGLVRLFRGVQLSKRACTGLLIFAVAGIIVPYVAMIAFGGMPQWLLLLLNALFFSFSLPFIALGVLAIKARGRAAL